MGNYVVNVAINATIIVRDNAGAAVTGLTDASTAFTAGRGVIEAYDESDGTTAAVSFTERNAVTHPGEYKLTFTPSTPTTGNTRNWLLYVVYDDTSGGVFQEWVGSYPVDAVAATSAPAYTTIGDIATVQQMLRADTSVTFDTDVTDRLTALQALVSEQLQFKLGRTFGVPAADTTLLIYAGAGPTLWLPRPARAITSVTAWGDVAGGTFSNGTLLTTTDYAHDPIDFATGLIYGLRMIGAFNSGFAYWGADDALGFGITPTQVVGDFSDTDDDAYVPADVNYAANFLIMALFRREQGIPYSMTTANGLEIPLDPWKDSVVMDVIERYQVSGRDWKLIAS